MLVQGYHYPFPGLAHVEKTATGYREIPGGLETGHLKRRCCMQVARPPAPAAFLR